MTTRKSIDKVAKLLDLLDKHIKEQNCRHSPKELLREYEIDDCLNFIDNIEKNKFVECFESLSYLITLTSPLIVSNLIHKRPIPSKIMKSYNCIYCIVIVLPVIIGCSGWELW